MKQREIKFRCWDKDNKEMSFFSLGDVPELYSDKDIVMQFCGLLDKNGKEIYEGDICKAPHDFGPGGWSERTFTVYWDNEKGYQWSYWKLDELEIIGNVFENPDLLTK